jgi:cytochrome oxidase Cu insertion factor (SCO1/SenC/PrrC family)
MLKKVLIGVGILVVAFAAFVLAELYHYPKAQVATATYQTAPEFTLQDGEGQPFSLASLRGHKVVLFFYRGYW